MDSRVGVAVGQLQELLHGQTALLDELALALSREHPAELNQVVRSRQRRSLDRVRVLLAGQGPAPTAGSDREGLDGELGYDFDAEHLGLIVRGVASSSTLGDLAGRLDRRLLWVASGEETVWAWLAGQRPLRMGDFEHAVRGQMPARAVVAVGEPARGFEGWRVTHRQAQAALTVALRRPRRLTRYADVALLAAALADETLAGALTDLYLLPLQDARDGGCVLRETLQAYLAAERNTSSTAARLGVARSTIVNRLHAVEDRLGRRLGSCLAELEVALQLVELDTAGGPAPGSLGPDSPRSWNQRPGRVNVTAARRKNSQIDVAPLPGRRY